LVVPNLLLGNTILLTNTRSYPQQAQRIGEINDAGELPPGSRGERMPPLLDPSWVSEARRWPRRRPWVTPRRGFRVVHRCGWRHGPLHQHHRTSCHRHRGRRSDPQSVNLTGKPDVVRKNRRPSDIGTGWQQLAHPGALVGFRIRHRETTPPPISAACPGPPVDEHW